MKIKIYKEAVVPEAFGAWITVNGVRTVNVGMQNGVLCIWYIRSNDRPGLKFQYKIVETGQDFDGDCVLAGSVIDPLYDWHILERSYKDEKQLF